MSSCGLILAAHGSRYEPAVNVQIRSYAAAITERSIFDEVGVAFHQGQPAFRNAIDELRIADIVVVPVMTSAGYYSDRVLPRELRLNRRYSQTRVRQTIPLGLHPSIPRLVDSRLDCISAEQKLAPGQTTISIIGHGTPKHPTSRSSTESLASSLMESGKWAQVFSAFIDEEPAIEAVLRLAEWPNIIVIPFLIGAGPHAVADIPTRLELCAEGKARLPLSAELNGRRLACDVPVGSDPRIIDLIIDLATTAASTTEPTAPIEAFA